MRLKSYLHSPQFVVFFTEHANQKHVLCILYAYIVYPRSPTTIFLWVGFRTTIFWVKVYHHPNGTLHIFKMVATTSRKKPSSRPAIFVPPTLRLKELTGDTGSSGLGTQRHMHAGKVGPRKTTMGPPNLHSKKSPTGPTERTPKPE